MQPTFGLQREQTKELFYTSYDRVKGKIHFHSHLELFFVDSGEIDVFINEKTRRLKKGEMSVTLSYDAHAYHAVGDARSSILIIPPHLCEEFIAKVKHKKIRDPFICDKELVCQIREYYEEIKKSGDNKLKIQGYIYLIFGSLFEHISFTSDSGNVDTDLSSSLLIYLNENYKSDLSLSSVAAKFGYNASYVSRLFKNNFNIGFNHYLNVIRLKNAVLLMQENKHSITYCALESGFNSMCTFYRAFYEEFGCKPKDYMKIASQ
ncbi:MAG: helix-turn-helix domain-containing protein [Ruminococcaceae bacterium]|nr:helix-turn-helix domain-containing protein [Oscillospiraceae bacterium]